MTHLTDDLSVKGRRTVLKLFSVYYNYWIIFFFNLQQQIIIRTLSQTCIGTQGSTLGQTSNRTVNRTCSNSAPKGKQGKIIMLNKYQPYLDTTQNNIYFWYTNLGTSSLILVFEFHFFFPWLVIFFGSCFGEGCRLSFSASSDFLLGLGDFLELFL